MKIQELLKVFLADSKCSGPYTKPVYTCEEVDQALLRANQETLPMKRVCLHCKLKMYLETLETDRNGKAN